MTEKKYIMSNIKKKFLAGLVALTCAVMITAPGTVGAAMTADELQKMIDSLLAQIADLQVQLAELEGDTPAPAPAIEGCDITSFDRALKLGMTGDDVKCLQIVLNSDVDTKIADSGVGSPGKETSYFGPLTKSGVIKFQEKYADDILASWGLTKGTGFVGSTTRAKLNELLKGPVCVTGAWTDDVCGGGTCAVDQMRQTRTVSPAGCAEATQCVASDTCSGCACGDWVNTSCGAGTCSATQMQQTRTCAPSGCAAETQCVADTSCETPAVEEGLTVALASDTPAIGTVVDGQALASLAKFTFTNGDSSEVKITKLKLKKLGIVADATFTNVYLFDGALRLTDAASVSSGVISFNDSTGIFTVGSQKSKTISVLADIDGTSGETLGVGINSASDITSDASAVNGTFPMNGNLMSLATATLASVDFNATTTPTATEIDPQDDYVVWQNVATVSTRAVDFTRFSLKEIGTIEYTDLQNFDLYVDSVLLVESAQLDDKGYVTFDMTGNPVELKAGARTIKVVADIIDGSDRTFKMALRTSSDANFTDSEYGVNVLPTTGGTAFSSADVTTGVQTINSGTITLTKKSDSPSSDIVNGAPAVTLAEYEIKAAGEKVKIESLTVRAIFTNTVTTGDEDDTETLRNGMLLADGVQVGSTKSITTAAAGTEFTLGSSLIVEPGSPVTLKVVADVYDNAGSVNDIDVGDSLQVRIVAGSSNAEGMTSKSSINVPSADVDANALTVGSGGITLAKYTSYTNQSIVAPVNNQKIGHFTLTANTTEDVNLSTIDIDFTDTGSFDASDDLTNLYVKYGDKTTSTKATVTDSNNSWSMNYTLSAGSTINIEVYANIGANAGSSTSDTLRADIRIDGTTTSSSTAVYGTDDSLTTGSNIAGQTITAASGTFSAVVAGGTPVAQVVTGNQTITTAQFNWTAINESYTIKNVTVSLGSGVSAIVEKAILKDGDTILQEQPFDELSATRATFTGVDVAVDANTTKTLTVDLVLGTPVADYSTSGLNVKTTLYSYKYADSQGSETTTTATDVNGNNIYVYRSIPTLAAGTITGSTLNNSQETYLYDFTVTADSNGDVALKQLKFNLAWSDAGTSDTLQLASLRFYRDSTDLTDLVTIQDASGSSAKAGQTALTEADSSVIVTFATEEVIGAGESKTYKLKATPSGFHVAGASDTVSDSVSIYLLDDAAHDTSNAYLNAGTTVTGITKLYSSAAAGNASAVNKNIIWSDYSAATHALYPGSVGADSTNDWYDGNLLVDLPLTSVTWSK